MAGRCPFTAVLVVTMSVAGAASSFGQVPRLVKDLNTAGAGSGPFLQAEMDGFVYLIASEPDHGAELWKTDGTAEGTTLVRDVWPGPRPSDPFFVVRAGDTIFFSPDTEEYGRELWKSDGTEGGTVLVKDILPGSQSGFPEDMVAVDDRLFFVARDERFDRELWTSDGTEAGTRMVKDILTDDSTGEGFGLGPRWLTASDGKVFFQAYDGVHGEELWVSDGTEAGTRLVKDIRPGKGASDPEELFDWNGTLFFAADDGDHGKELWKSDGTEAGTVLVRDIFPGGQGSSFPYGLTLVGDTLFFEAEDGEHGAELYRTDGTEAGTVLVKDVRPGLDSGGVFSIVDVDGTAFFFAADFSRTDELFNEIWELWTSDGTEAGTRVVREVRPGGLGFGDVWALEFEDELVFAGGNPDLGVELWASDGTAAGTRPVKDIFPGPRESLPSSLTRLGDRVLFSAGDGEHGRELWASDGTETGTLLVRDINFKGTIDSWPMAVAELGGILYFAAYEPDNGFELWRSDGTAAGTFIVRDINPEGSGFERPFSVDLVTADGKLFFFANDGDHGEELWTSDGTRAGTRLVKDIFPDDTGSRPFLLMATEKEVFFGGSANRTSQLWRSDGTEEGTLVVDKSRHQHIEPFASLGGLAFFAKGDELWRSDGTPEGTFKVADVPVASDFKTPGGESAAAGDILMFTPSGFAPELELWRTDGTLTGTFRVKDIHPGPASSFPARLKTFANGILFQADDGVRGSELWFSDGSQAGTYLVKDINPGPRSSSPGPVAVVGGSLYFGVLFDPEGFSRGELWKTDGTAAGTRFVSRTVPSDHSSVAAIGDRLYFTSREVETGEELWRTDGTRKGTRLIADLLPGSAGSRPRDLTAVGGKLFFSALSERYGHELWVLEAGLGNGAGRFVRLPDLDGSGGDEVASMFSSVSVQDAASGREILRSPLAPDAGWEAVDLESLPDLDGNGAAELAILARKRKRTRVFVRDALTGDLVSTVRLHRGRHALDLEIVPNGGKAVPGVAVLARSGLGGPGWVTVKGLAGAGDLDVSLVDHFEALDLEVVPGLGDDDRPALVVLGRSGPDGRARILAIDLRTGLELVDRTLPGGLVPLDLEIVQRRPGAPGFAAVLVEKDRNGAARVLTVDLVGGATIRTTRFSKKRQALDLEITPGRNGTRTTASVLLEDRLGGKVRVATVHALSGRKRWTATFPGFSSALDLASLFDVERTGLPRVAVLGEAECAAGGPAIGLRSAAGSRVGCHAVP